mgnify:CR=1 FL=1
MFFEDAITVSKELELTLTGKACGLEEKAPMCGVPQAALDTYIAKLIQKGFKEFLDTSLKTGTGTGTGKKSKNKLKSNKFPSTWQTKSLYFE